MGSPNMKLWFIFKCQLCLLSPWILWQTECWLSLKNSCPWTQNGYLSRVPLSSKRFLPDDISSIIPTFVWGIMDLQPTWPNTSLSFHFSVKISNIQDKLKGRFRNKILHQDSLILYNLLNLRVWQGSLSELCYNSQKWFLVSYQILPFSEGGVYRLILSHVICWLKDKIRAAKYTGRNGITSVRYKLPKCCLIMTWY